MASRSQLDVSLTGASAGGKHSQQQQVWNFDAAPSPIRPPPPAPGAAQETNGGINVSHAPAASSGGAVLSDRSGLGGALVGTLNHSTATTSAGYRVSDMQNQLVSLDRDVAALREDAAIRAAECGMLKSALQREHETNLRLQSKHHQELEQLRSEYDRQTSHLLEQLAVLKSVSESAVADRKRVQDEAQSRKVHLMQLLEKEREEKANIMADYRQQTEQLISEQGREISQLRELLEVARSEEEKLLQAAARNEERRAEAETLLLRAENALMDEKAAGQRRLRDVESKHQSELDGLRQRHELSEQEWNETKQKMLRELTHRDDQLRSAAEKFDSYERDSEGDRQQLRAHYEAAVERLTQELKKMNEVKEANESSMREEIDRLSKGDEKLVASLRQEVEKARAERHAAAEEGRRAREVLVIDHQRRVQELQEQLAEIKTELAEESTQRKDLDAQKQSLLIRAEALQSANARLTHELERMTVDSRARERRIEQEGLDLAEQLRTANRQVEAENARMRQQIKQLEIDEQRSADDVASAKSALETAKSDARMMEDRLKSALDHANRQLEAARVSHQRAVDAMQQQRMSLESEVQQLLRSRDELEARVAAATKQLAEERRALEQSVADAQAQRTAANDARVALDSLQIKWKAATDGCNERDVLLARKQESLVAVEGHLRESSREAALLREEMDKLRKEHERALETTVADHNDRVQELERQVQQAQKQMRQCQEAALASENQAQDLREEVNKWQRECMIREESANEAAKASRDDVDEEFGRLETTISSLRDELSRAQAQKIAAQREVAEALHEGQRRVAIVQETLDLERQSKHRLTEELRMKEQVIAEMNGNARLLSTRLNAKEEDIRRYEYDLNDAANRLHDAHSLISKKEAVVGQLMARLRVFESRNIASS